MKTTITLLPALALLLAASTANAHAGRGAALKRLDSDGDQRLSREEATLAPRLAQQFPLIDRNADGLLDREEIKAYAEQRRALREEAMGKRFALLDANGDGVLAGEEIEGKRRLERRDTNQDGRIELAEFRQPPRWQGKRCWR